MAAQPEPAAPTSVASRNEPPCSQPRTSRRTTQSRARGARGRPERLEDADRHRPDLAVETRLHGPRHVRHVAFGGHLRTAGPQLEFAEHDPAALRRGEPARRPVVDRQPWQERRLGPDPAAGRLECRKFQPGPSGACWVWAMLPVNCMRLSPHTSTEGVSRTGAPPGCRTARDDRHRCATAWPSATAEHLPGRGVDADGGRSRISPVLERSRRASPHTGTSRLSRPASGGSVRARPRGTRPWTETESCSVLVASCWWVWKLRVKGPARDFDLGAAGDLAAAALVVEIDVELGDAPDALAAALVDNDSGGLEPDLAQIGTGVLAAPGARGALRQHLDEIDAAEGRRHPPPLPHPAQAASRANRARMAALRARSRKARSEAQT